MARLRILVADDHPLVRRSIRELLETESGWEVCGEAATGFEAVERAERLLPNFVVMDLVMPRQNGLEATREIVKRHPEIRVLILTLHDYPDLQREAKNAGASACLLKGGSADSLLDTVRNLQT
jgi:DNA-binding NarL/FixJ family response regulator